MTITLLFNLYPAVLLGMDATITLLINLDPIRLLYCLM